MRTLRVLKTSTLSVVSAITLSIRSGCLSLTDRAPESSLRLSQWTPVPRWLLSGLHANYCNQTQVFLILHLTHLLTAVSWVFLPLQTSLNHAPLATVTFSSGFMWQESLVMMKEIIFKQNGVSSKKRKKRLHRKSYQGLSLICPQWSWCCLALLDSVVCLL